MDEKPRSFWQLLARAKHRGVVPAIVAVSGINAGVALRFWKSLFNRPDPQFTIDWTPLVYWGIGIIGTIITLRVTRHSGPRFSKVQRQMLLSLNGLILAAYLLPPMLFVYHSFSRFWN